jgi:predicted alpha/beta superfamily hydrolase
MGQAPPDLIFHPAVQTHLLRSQHVQQTFQIQVLLPAQRGGESTRFPVVYAADANRCFDMFKGISHLLQSTERDGSRFILVGVGYPSDSPVAGFKLLARDFAFPGYPWNPPELPPLEGVLSAEPGTKDFGGADDFQQFIEHELIPFIDAKYPTVRDERTYFGHSAGGGFGLYTLFSKPQLFKSYLISSPGLFFHGQGAAGKSYENDDFMLREARRFLDSGKPLPGVKLYLSVGAQEEFEPELAPWQLTSSFYRLAALLKAAAIPGLEFITEVFEGETHMTAWPIAFMHGVRRVMCGE